MEEKLRSLRENFSGDFTTANCPAIRSELTQVQLDISDAELLGQFTELEDVLGNYIQEIGIEYESAVNDVQLINDTEERNLEILERTSEILRRSMVNSCEEVQKLLSQVYANTTIAMNTGDSLEYAYSAKYRLKVAKNSMEIVQSANPLAIIKSLFKNAPFNHKKVVYVVSVLEVVTSVLPNMTISSEPSNRISVNDVRSCIQSQLENVIRIFKQAFDFKDMRTMKHCALTYKMIYEKILKDLNPSTSHKSNAIHVEFVGTSLYNLSKVQQRNKKKCKEIHEKRTNALEPKDTQKATLAEIFKLCASTYNVAMSTIVQIFDESEQRVVQGNLIQEIFLNPKYGLLSSINDFIGIPIEMKMFEETHEKDVKKVNKTHTNGDNIARNSADSSEQIDLQDLMWVFQEITYIFSILPADFQDSETIYSNVLSLFSPFIKQMMLQNEENYKVACKKFLQCVYDDGTQRSNDSTKLSKLVSPESVVESQEILHQQLLSIFEKSLKMTILVAYLQSGVHAGANGQQIISYLGDNSTNTKHPISEDIPVALTSSLQYILPLYRHLCSAVERVCEVFDSDENNEENPEVSIDFFQSVMHVVETQFIGNSKCEKIVSNMFNLTKSSTLPEGNGFHIYNAGIAMDDVAISNTFRPFYEERYRLISALEKLLNKTIKSWLKTRISRLENMLKKDYKVTHFLGEISDTFRDIKQDFLKTFKYMQLFMNSRNLSLCMVNYMRGFLAIFFKHVLSEKYDPEQAVQIKWDLQQLEKLVKERIFTELVEESDMGKPGRISHISTLKSVIDNFKRLLEILIVYDYPTAKVLCHNLVQEDRERYEQNAINVLKSRKDA